MHRTIRLATIKILLILVPLGFSTKFYSGPGQNWIGNYAGDIFYPMFWFFLVLFFWPQISPLKLASAVFLFSTAIEFTQLLSNPMLTKIRSTFIGRTLIGTGFAPLDILYYLIGCALALGLHRALYLFQFPLSAQKPQR